MTGCQDATQEPAQQPLPADLGAALTAAVRRPGGSAAPVLFLLETTSTNDLALRAARQGAPEGALFIAEAQTAGRGRGGRTWFSPRGAGLYVSIVLRPPWGGSSGFTAGLLSLAAGVALTEAVRFTTGLPVELKWPNDLVFRVGEGERFRKVGGILAEAGGTSTTIEHVVVGFGINLRPAAYPPEIAGRAGSLDAETGRVVDRAALLVQVLEQIERRRTQLARGATAAVLARWRELSPSSMGAPVQCDSAGGQVRGMTAGIGEEGALLVRAGGRLERIISGEVHWL